MYGVPKELNLKRFHGATLSQICIGEFQQQFHFLDPELIISVEGDWQIKDAAGAIIDRNMENDHRDAYRAHGLLGRILVAHEVNAPKSFTLRFDNGWLLVVFDNSPQYESFSIQPGDIFI
jgi:hypothetical protein